MVKVREISETAAIAWSHDSSPLLASGTLAGVMDDTFSSESYIKIHDPFKLDGKPLAEGSVSGKFHSISWSAPFKSYTKGLIAGGLENGTIQLWDAEKFLKTGDLESSLVSELKKHTGAVLKVAFNPIQQHILASSGHKGEIYVWDTTKGTSYAPGQAMSPLDKVSSLSWNNSMPHIFASAGNTGYASIWDLKSKREVLQLSYSGANLSVVEWHPTQSTKLATASDTDSSPVILTWDLRNASTPEQELRGHKKGILSLDWCKQDPEFLLSSGKDDTTVLWNPIKGSKLCEYPSMPNWIHEAKFAPRLPDIIARASYDKKISIDTLQDTTTPDKVKVNTSNETDFWNTLSTTDTQVPVVSVRQAPSWLKRPVSVNFGFGGKIVIVSKTGASSSTVITTKAGIDENITGYADRLSKAIQSGDFKALVETKDETDDWKLIKKVLNDGNLSLLKEQLPTPKTEEVDDTGVKEADINDDDFFNQLAETKDAAPAAHTITPYTPKGTFKLFDSKNEFEKSVIEQLLVGKNEKALDLCISNDKILEGLVLALNGSETMKKKVQDAYFAKYATGTSLARVLYSSANADVTDLVENADIESWKEIAASVLSSGEGKSSFSDNISKLGDRILNSSLPSARSDAIACYVAGGALDKVTEIWISELPKLETYFTNKEKDTTKTPFEARFKALGEVVEKIISCVSTIDEIDDSKLVVSGSIFKEFAESLANNGYFELAYKLLNKIPETVPGIKLEKERVSKAFIKKATAPTGTATAKARGYSTAGASSSTLASRVSAYPVPVATAPGSKLSYSPASVASSLKPQPSNPYARLPSVSGAPVRANPYQIPPPAMSPAVPAASPALSAPANPYAPRTALDSLKVQQSPLAYNHVGIQGASQPSFEAPKPPSFKRDQGGWNDLPTSLASQPPKRSAQPAVPSAYQHLPRQESKRNISQAPSMPPPPRSISRGSNNGSAAPPAPSTPASGPAPPKPNRYEPVHNSQPPTPGYRSPSAVSHQPPQRPPSVNPYAPKPEVQGPVKIPMAHTNISQAPLQPTSPVLAARNPYAPKPDAFGSMQSIPGHSRSLSSNGHHAPQHYESPAAFMPPRQSSVPPPPHQPSIPPPPQRQSNIPPPPQARSVAASPHPPSNGSASTGNGKYPSGDRTHIPPESVSIFQILSNDLNTYREKVPEKFARHIVDAEKRLNILFDSLNNSALSPSTINQLAQLTNALSARDFPTAEAIQSQLLADKSNDLWMLGVKRLVGIVKALGA